ncbi:MAG: hypothetical protein V1803_00215 [Candidatus Roizmanbacteria bacterium]
MKKLIISIISVIILLFLAIPVFAENVAGDSAGIVLSFKISQKDMTDMKEYKTKRAIKSLLQKYNSPMVSEVDAFYNTCKKYDLDCYLLPSIAGLESFFGTYIIPGSFNAFGWGRGLIPFKNWGEAINIVGKGLRENYMNKWGASTVEEIGRIYCEGNTWASRVTWFMKEFTAEEEKISLFLKTNPVQL